MTLAPLTQVLIAAAVALFLFVVIVPTALTLLLWAQVAAIRLKAAAFNVQARFYRAQAQAYTAMAQRLAAMNARADSWADRSGAQLRAMQDDLSKEPFAKRSREQQLEHMHRHFATYTAILAVKSTAALVVLAAAIGVGVALARVYGEVAP